MLEPALMGLRTGLRKGGLWAGWFSWYVCLLMTARGMRVGLICVGT